MGQLTGKVAFITGAARGQGRAHAVTLAAAGADIIAFDLCRQIDSVPYPLATPDDLDATVKSVEEAGARIVAVQGDVRDRDAIKAAIRTGTEALGERLDIVVANAGIAPMAADDAWQDVIDVNLTGVYHTVDVAMKPMIKFGNGGSIVAVSSVAGLAGIGAPIAGSVGYTAAKHGIVGIMRAYANFLAQYNIRVNSVHPAGVNTPMIDNDFTRSWLEGMAQQHQGGGPDMSNALPVQTLEPQDIANAVLWLVSDAARYVTGVTLPVDAGYLNKR
ncbi:mycofactocin-coupled SDR family oxidoreductase [Mycolicibacterium sp.]|uniref:mycofactocin-coupled SDR family oxidoreductase n=1 Tax=Mycolicibacterium sp. TaxID=2320850 RepID=UPI003D0DD09F